MIDYCCWLVFFFFHESVCRSVMVRIAHPRLFRKSFLREMKQTGLMIDPSRRMYYMGEAPLEER